MRRIKLVLAVGAVMVALLVAFSAPAMAHDNNDWRWHDNDFDNHHFFNNDGGVHFSSGDQESVSGDVEQEFSVTNTGNNSNQCVGFQGFGNSGNLQNTQGALQFDSWGDVGFGGGGFDFAPEAETNCTQQVQQSSAASGGWW